MDGAIFAVMVSGQGPGSTGTFTLKSEDKLQELMKIQPFDH